MPPPEKSGRSKKIYVYRKFFGFISVIFINLASQKKTMKLKDIDPQNRPKERLAQHGPIVLSNAELLAIILRTGSKYENVVDMSNRLISKYGFDKLSSCSLNELQAINGIGSTKASQIVAFFELFKRVLS
jgi:DNA repair protein RadC